MIRYRTVQMSRLVISMSRSDFVVLHLLALKTRHAGNATFSLSGRPSSALKFDYANLSED